MDNNHDSLVKTSLDLCNEIESDKLLEMLTGYIEPKRSRDQIVTAIFKTLLKRLGC